MLSMDPGYGFRRGGPHYDWAGDGRRTREEYPYSFSAHYIFRDGAKVRFGIEGADGFYTDRMRSWEPEKFERAMKGFGFYGTLPSGNAKVACNRAAKIYFGEDAECVGYALDCNVSNGYPIGIFFIKRNTSQ